MKHLKRQFKRIGPRRSALIWTVGVIIGCFSWFVFSQRPGAASPSKSSTSGAQAFAKAAGATVAVTQPAAAASASLSTAAATRDLRRWLADLEAVKGVATNDARRTSLMQAGVALAAERKAGMKQLIRDDPRQALAQALRFDEYNALPLELQPFVERPFSDRAEYSYLPVCFGPNGEQPGNGPDHVSMIALTDGTQAEAFTFGQRAGVMSKHSLPASGIVLDGVAALQDGVFREVQAPELAVVQAQFKPGQPDMTRSFATGKSLPPTPVIALAGDRLYAFADAAEMNSLGAQLATLDAKPGPKAGSSVIYYEALPADPSNAGAFNWQGAENYAADEADAWTETKKRIFLIRVDFSDLPGAQVSQAAASTEMNGASSDFIRAMSYGKTWIEATVSSNVYRLPQTAAHYADTGNAIYSSSTFSSLNSDLMRDARNAFRNTKSGGDAAINIGPVDNNTGGTGAGGGLGDYDIVAIFFGSIGMKSGGLLYAGLAGGGDMWVQNANYTSLYTHEIGHNYGLGHASFWQTTDGSVIGAGNSIEYGDPFDVMGAGPAILGHYNPQAKALLNWITTNQWVDITNSGTYRIYRIDDPNTTGTLRGARITRSSAPGSQEYYWIGYRTLFTNNPSLLRGAYLIWQRPGQSRCWLIDTTPNSAGGINDSPVDLGKTYADTAINAFVTPLDVGGSGSDQYLDVRVNLGAFPSNHPPSAPGITGPTLIAARTSASYSVSATDPDGDSLAYYWNTQDGVVNSNAPGLSHTWTVGGTNALVCTISDAKGGTFTVSNSVIVTDPLDTWTQGTVGTTANLQDIVAGKGRFVSVDWFGNAFLSWDGTGWENVGGLPNYDNTFSSHPQLAFGQNLFVAAGRRVSTTNAQICWSLDGRLWSEASIPAGLPQLYDVAYGNGQFVAVGGSGTVLRSTNGVNWTMTTVPGATDFSYVTWDGGAWVVIALNSPGGYPQRAWTSLDGITWNQQGLLSMQVLEVFSYGNTAYALGYYGGIQYSTDHGVTWQSATTPGTTAWSAYHAAAGLDGTLLVAGQAMSESGQPYATLVSTDGRTWSRSSGNATVAGNSHGLAFGHGSFLSVESGGVTRRCAAFYPSNSTPVPTFTTAPTTGTARTAIYFAASATDANGDAVNYAWDFGPSATVADGFETAPVFSLGGTYNLTLRVSDGHGGITNLSRSIAVSDPARTWTHRTNSLASNLSAIAAGTTNVVAVGDNGAIVSSPDGVTWTTRTVPDYAGNIYFFTITWDGARYLAGGQDYDFGIGNWVGIIYSSTNGVNWTRVYKSSTGGTSVSGIAASGATRVAVGSPGVVLASANGTNWNSVTIPGLGTVSMSGAAYGNGTFVFVGFTGSNGGVQCYTSVDGTNWVNRAAGTGVDTWQDLRQVAWLNNRFVANGWYSKLRVSTNSGQTFTSNRSHTEDLPAQAYGDGIWFTAGVDRDNANANVDVMSLDGANWISFAGHMNTNCNGATFYQHTFISVGLAGSIWQSGVLSPATGLQAWELANFPAGGISALPNHDADGDGVINAIEYALGRNPNIATGSDGASQMPRGTILANRPAVHLDLPEPAPFDVIYVVAGSTNLNGIWSNLASKNGTNAWQWVGGGSSHLNVGAVSGGRVGVDVASPDTANGTTKYYFRFQIQTP